MRTPHEWTPEQRAKLRTSRARALKRMRSGGYIYAAEVVGTDIVKIGYALDPASRMKGLAQDTPRRWTYRVLSTAPGTFTDEIALHRALRNHRHPDWLRLFEYYPRSILNHPAIPAELRRAA